MARGHPQKHELLDYLEGSLDAAARAGVKEHLDGCATCRELVDEVTAGKRLVAAAPMLELSEARADRILASLDEPAAPKAQRDRPRWRLAVVIAAALALALPISYLALNGSGSDDGGSTGAAAQEAAPDTDAGGAGGETSGGAEEPTAPELTVVRGVEAKPARIVRALRNAGYTADAEAGAVVVVVEDAKAKDVAALLDDRFEPGDTLVFYRPPSP